MPSSTYKENCSNYKNKHSLCFLPFLIQEKEVTKVELGAPHLMEDEGLYLTPACIFRKDTLYLPKVCCICPKLSCILPKGTLYLTQRYVVSAKGMLYLPKVCCICPKVSCILLKGTLYLPKVCCILPKGKCCVCPKVSCILPKGTLYLTQRNAVSAQR